MKKLAVLPLVLMLTLVCATAVQAGPPEHNNPAGTADFHVFDCANFEVWDQEEWSVAYMDVLDTAGNWAWTNYHEQGVDHLYNHNLGYDKSRVLAGPYGFNCQLVPYTGNCPSGGQCVIMKCSGTSWNIHLPNNGMLFHEAGFSYELSFWPGGDMGARETLVSYKANGMGKYDGDTVCKLLAP